jgi:hypothetical protein
MNRKGLLLYFFLIAGKLAFAQKPADLLNQWSSRSPIEKVYLHFDRDSYMAGETAWFKAYLYADYQPDFISSTLYTELLRDSTLISRNISPVLLGSSNGQFELPDTLATGNYIVRAYTATMLNSNPVFVYQRTVFIFGKTKTMVSGTFDPAPSLRMDFFPEGGNLISGFANTIAFKTTDKNGMPAAASGTIHNEKNEEIASFNTYHDGMGMFELKPDAGATYYAVTNGNVSAEKFYLPAATVKGIVTTVMPHPQGYFFELQQRIDDPSFQAAYMIGQMQHRVVFRQNFTAGKGQLQGVINTQNLHSGILQITFFNKDNLPLAERLCFVNNKEYILPVSLTEDTINAGARARNRISLHFKDTVQGSFSVSVTDNEYSKLPVREETIFTSLLLTSDIKGYVHNPAFYFSAGNDSVKTALDLVMMTNGWRRFKWEQLFKEGFAHLKYKDNAYITLAGKVNLQNTKKPFSDKQLLLFITGREGKRSTQFLQTDGQGNFSLDSIIFFDKTRLLFSDVRGKKSQYIDVLLNGDSLRRNFPLPGIEKKPSIANQTTGVASRWKTDYDAILKANGLMLEEVKLKVQKKSPLQQVDERYTAGMFSGDAAKAIDLVNNDEASSYQNIFDYLQARVNGLQIAADGFDYSVYYRQSVSASSMGNIPMALFLDEVETDAAVIATIPASQVALVKVYSSFVAAAGNAPGGVLAVYTKKGQDYLNGAGIANQAAYNGYSVIKEFYSPDYKTIGPAGDNKPDNRVTLQWRPNIFINSIDPVIPVSFYNNDRTKQYRIVVEGITVLGKMVSIEKIITPGKKSF